MRALILSSLFFILVQPLFAEEEIRYYDVELVVFENLEDSTDNNEIWPRGKQLEVPEKATKLGQTFSGELPPDYDKRLLFKLLRQKDYQLTEEVESLKEADNYRVLLHTGWRQPGLARGTEIPIHFTHIISNGRSEEETPAELTGGTERPGAVEPPAGGAAKTPQFGPTIPTHQANLQGIITVVLSRYLHVDVEMLYQKEGEDRSVDMFDTSFLEDNSDREPIYYLKQNRRMRSKKTHYIDHPRFSMLVRITPFKVETPVTTAPQG